MESENNIIVSVVCMTYNHEKYIRDALDGIVNQKTNFQYEVIVHDDASTDGTARIIREYAEKYPQIIKPIFETENQYSKGVTIGKTIVYPKIRGKYVAMCEGDDYWNNINKLQKQVDFLESHSEYSACVHNSIELNCRTGKKRIINNKKKDCQLNREELFENSTGLYQTSSLVYRKEFYILPDAFLINKIGDVPKAVYLSVVGKIYYFKDVMSVYRLYTEGSWSSRNVLNKNRNQNLINTNQNIIEMLKRVDLYTNGEYHKELIKAQRMREYNILKFQKNYKKLLTECKDVLKNLSLKEKLKITVALYMPFIEKIYWKHFYRDNGGIK